MAAPLAWCAITLLLACSMALAHAQQPARRLLDTGTALGDPVQVVKVILEPAAFQLIGDIKLTKPKPEGGLDGLGLVDFDDDEPHHVMETLLPAPKRAIAMSTGTFYAAKSVVPFDIQSVEVPNNPDVSNSNIKDSHDAVVLDFWVQALRSGSIKLDAWFASNECQPEAEYPGRKPRDDTFHFEVNGERLEKLSDASTVSYKTMHMSRDVVKPAPVTMEYCEYVKVGVRRFKVTKGQKLRIKFRLADRGDRLFDSAVYLRNRGLSIRT